MGLSSPNRMVCSCFRSLQRHIAYLVEENDENKIRDIAASSVVMAVTAVETFVNMHFRILVEEEKYKSFKSMVVDESESTNGNRPKGLEQKLNSWPNKILNKNIDFNNGIAKEFEEMRVIRNNLTHFVSGYEAVAYGNVEIRGLANTDAFDSLKKEDGERALRVAKEFIEHILSLSGVKEENLPHAMHHWGGFVPEYES